MKKRLAISKDISVKCYRLMLFEFDKNFSLFFSLTWFFTLYYYHCFSFLEIEFEGFSKDNFLYFPKINLLEFNKDKQIIEIKIYNQYRNFR